MAELTFRFVYSADANYMPALRSVKRVISEDSDVAHFDNMPAGATDVVLYDDSAEDWDSVNAIYVENTHATVQAVAGYVDGDSNTVVVLMDPGESCILPGSDVGTGQDVTVLGSGGATEVLSFISGVKA